MQGNAPRSFASKPTLVLMLWLKKALMAATSCLCAWRRIPHTEGLVRNNGAGGRGTAGGRWACQGRGFSEKAACWVQERKIGIPDVAQMHLRSVDTGGILSTGFQKFVKSKRRGELKRERWTLLCANVKSVEWGVTQQDTTQHNTGSLASSRRN
jgi:hypothetical protein